MKNTIDKNTQKKQLVAAKKTCRIKVLMTFLTTLAISVISLNPSYAEDTECKSLEQDICETESFCKWVNSYERKDGKVINGYCRKGNTTKKGKQASSKQTNTKKNSAVQPRKLSS